ncbi:MAG TPA: M23 family metallopeptidase [Candidatus Paceibacterota bacterium]|nr:M23 family metallopeptidase [Candidatus Paceibacterota bacterium]
MSRVLFTIVLVVASIFLLWRVIGVHQTAGVAAGDIPLTNAKTRVTKKTFGLYVTPTDSPVSPEKFTGYHTGLDFETTPAEADVAVTVRALCDGTLLLKKWATGYGGVAVQSCMLDGQAVTVIYGHLNIDSVTMDIGAALHRGDAIAVLGKGYSTETDGERKHLHLGIHKGTTVNILGYVQKKSDLAAWLDPAPFIH